MKNARNIVLISLSLILILSPMATYSLPAVSLPQGKKFVIAFDVFHNPIISYKDYIRALNSVNNTLPITIGLINSTIDNRILSGVDLLVLLPKGEGSRYKEEEAKAISRYLEMGGSLLILGSYNPKFKEVDINSLLSTVEVQGKRLSDYFSFATSEVEGVEDSVYLYDDFSPYSNKSLLEVNVSNWDLLANSSKLVIQSIAIEAKDKDVKKIYATHTTYGRNARGEPCCYLNETPVIASMWEHNRTRVSIVGFGEAFTNISSPLGTSWVELGDNLAFFEALIFWLVKPEFFQPKQLVRPSYVYIYTASLSIIMIPLAFLTRKIEKERERKKEEPKKLSELLKKARESS